VPPAVPRSAPIAFGGASAPARLAAAAGLAWALCAGGPAAAESAPDEPRFGYGLAIGYGEGVSVRARQQGADVGDVRALTLEPGVRLRLARPGADDAWYRGTLEATLEGLVILNFEPDTGHGGGVDLGLRYRMRRGARVEPLLDAALGIGGIGFDLQTQDDGLAFFISAGVGARFRVNEHVSITTSLRWLHVSNAQIHPPNAGIDTLGVRVGVDLW
jgi:hypothetical protein